MKRPLLACLLGILACSSVDIKLSKAKEEEEEDGDDEGDAQWS